MTTELEQEFFKVFGIEPIPIKSYGYWLIKGSIAENDKGEKVVYPEITDRKLLQLLCIYNDMQGYVEYCLTPCKYEYVKEMILNTLVNEKFAMIDCEEGTYMDVMTKQIQQLFKEEE
jgi:hypothetical protein